MNNQLLWANFSQHISLGDAQQYPAVTFEGILEKSAGDYTLVGDATIPAVSSSAKK